MDLILWIKQCPETTEKMVWAWKGLKNEFCNELFVIQNQFGFTTGDKNYTQILGALLKREAIY